MDKEFKKAGTKNVYFPMLVSKNRLETEAKHLEGFSPEVAWITRSGDTELDQPLAVRPTSETIIYPSFAKWIRSHRDLPMNLNQWCNIVRWEFKYPTPFLRSREFLWQEGHAAFASKEECDKHVLHNLDIYYRTYVDLLAVHVVKGKKSDHEKFAGSEYSTTVEAYIAGSGRGIQAGTSHALGQNFSKMFDISFLSKENDTRHVYQTCWGFTTRSIGIMVLIHSDDKGLVLPPRVAPKHVVIIPIIKKKDQKKLLDYVYDIKDLLTSIDIRVEVDDRDNYTPGWKYTDWEMRGVPLRIEIGMQEVENNMCTIVRRDNGVVYKVEKDTLKDKVPELLQLMHEDLYNNSKRSFEESLCTCKTWDEFLKCIHNGKIAYSPWCSGIECEDKIIERSTLHKTIDAKDPEMNSEFSKEPTPVEESKETDELQSRVIAGAKSLCIP